MIELDVEVPGGHVHAYDTGPAGDDDLAVVWHHGTPNVGTPPRPLLDLAASLGVRFVGFDRPGYGGSTAVPDRVVAVAAGCAAAVVDALGIGRFAVMSHSGGGPHALACAALLGPRVSAAAVISSLAPFDADGTGAEPNGEATNRYGAVSRLAKPGEMRHRAAHGSTRPLTSMDWFDGMGPVGEATLRAAAGGRAAREALAGDAAPDFTDADWDTLRGEWGWFGSVVEPALAGGPAPMIDDDVAYVSPWGFGVDEIACPVLYVHGSDDAVVPAAHGIWLAEHTPTAELWLTPGDGHISVMHHAAGALRWFRRI